MGHGAAMLRGIGDREEVWRNLAQAQGPGRDALDKGILRSEREERVHVWARVRLGGRPADIGCEKGFRDGGSVVHVV